MCLTSICQVSRAEISASSSAAMDFRGRQAIFFITLLCCVMNSEPIPLNLTRLPSPGPAPLNLTRLGIPGPVTLNLTGLSIPGPTPLNLTKVPIPNTLPATRYKFSYFVLGLQWPGAYDRECTHKRPPAFFIHGLWPELRLRKGEHSDDPLKLRQGDQLIRKLNSIWPSIIRPCNNSWFWEHEWQYHGAYSKLGSQRQYFSKTVTLAERVNLRLLRVLRQNGIRESSSTLYPARSFAIALQSLPGFGKIVCCVRRNELSEIRFCVDSTASRYINCPRSYNRTSRCGRQVKFLPFNSR